MIVPARRRKERALPQTCESQSRNVGRRYGGSQDENYEGMWNPGGRKPGRDRRNDGEGAEKVNGELEV